MTTLTLRKVQGATIMQVKDILARKGAHIFTIGSDASLLDLAVQLSEHKVGIMVCTDSAGGLIGVISERDLANAIGRFGPDALHKTVGSVMSRDVVACNLEDEADQLLLVMTEAHCRHLPVTDKGELIGLVSIGDLVKATIAPLT